MENMAFLNFFAIWSRRLKVEFSNSSLIFNDTIHYSK